VKLSDFGRVFCGDSGIYSLMEDLGEALNTNPDILFLGGGNPAVIPAFEQRVSEELSRLLDDDNERAKLFGVYQSPQGNAAFLDALADFLNREMDWQVSRENLAVCNGSQSVFFLLLNMFAGAASGAQRKILLPLMPEYLGYREQVIAPESFTSVRPHIELKGEHEFKYQIDFERLPIDEFTAALCVSRPTNPSGNVVTDAEMAHLNALSIDHNIPLIVDCAYGQPFPGLLYADAELTWTDNSIFVLSLSKLGLPGVRTGIVVAEPDLIQRISRANTVMSLASGNLGPALAARLLKGKLLSQLCSDIIQPFYQKKRATMLRLLSEHLGAVNYRLHRSEGAFFVWLWFPELSISAEKLYQRLKQRNVLVMAGEHFFYGLAEPWEHSRQCLRLNFCQDDRVMDQALAILAEELKRCHQ